jgi:hypothetical protein
MESGSSAPGRKIVELSQRLPAVSLLYCATLVLVSYEFIIKSVVFLLLNSKKELFPVFLLELLTALTYYRSNPFVNILKLKTARRNVHLYLKSYETLCFSILISSRTILHYLPRESLWFLLIIRFYNFLSSSSLRMILLINRHNFSIFA